MSNEAIKVELTNSTGFPRRFTVASAVAIAKGTVLALITPRTAIAHSAEGQACAGIALEDKSATDGSVDIAAWTDGIFYMLASGAITTGEAVELGIVANSVSNTALTAASGAAIVGYAMEDIADAGSGNVRIRL